MRARVYWNKVNLVNISILIYEFYICFSVHDAGDVENIGCLVREYGKLLLCVAIFLSCITFCDLMRAELPCLSREQVKKKLSLLEQG